ncbi:MAG: glycosyltransferase family 25 protein [Hyphomicrobiaceae bacterium]
MSEPVTFLINLDRCPSRLAAVDAQLSGLGVEYMRISGVDGQDKVPLRWVHEFDRTSNMKSGEIGCYASHLLICEQILERGFACAVILEDDVEIDRDFSRVVSEILGCAPDAWDIIHLSTKFKKPAFPVRSLERGRALVRYARLPVNSACYLISSRGAAKMLAPGLRKWPIDLEFRFAWERGLEIFGLYPPAVRQKHGIASTIDGRTPPMRKPFSLNRLQFEPGLLSRLRGWFYVRRRLGLTGTIYCSFKGLQNWKGTKAVGFANFRTWERDRTA